jgi:hypothetical protein
MWLDCNYIIDIRKLKQNPTRGGLSSSFPTRNKSSLDGSVGDQHSVFSNQPNLLFLLAFAECRKLIPPKKGG